MKLHPEPYEDIKNGSKNVEIRLYDAKRQLLELGDTITFQKRPDLMEKIIKTISKLEVYQSRKDLILNTAMKHFGNRYRNFTQEAYIAKGSPYYSEEDQNKYGFVAIHLSD